MFDHDQGYKDLHGLLDRSHEKFLRNNIKNLELFDKVLGFQFAMQYAVKDLRPRQLQDVDSILMDEIHDLCMFNIEHSLHAITQLEYSNFSVFTNTIRPIYESIPKMFYMLRHPEDVPALMFKESFELWRGKQSSNNDKLLVEQYFRDTFGVNADSDDIEPISKKPYKDIKSILSDRKKFTTAYYRRQIYTPNLRNKRDQTYGFLSHNSHANFIRHHKLDQDKLQTRYTEMLIHLSFFNVLLYTNAYAQVLLDMNEFDDTKKFIKEVYDELGGFLRGTSMYPDQTTYTSKLKIKLS
ncbi:MAG: hypothetical protein F4X32_02825 [Candidatus Dadabacteria bacterium]|nr:hypothetical protein [Candidatus Dadabacteria bacterium]